MWWPPEELPRAVSKLRAFAESFEFRDFRFSAIVIGGELSLQCDWGEAHACVAVPPSAFQDEGLLMHIAGNAIMAAITEAMRAEARVAVLC